MNIGIDFGSTYTVASIFREDLQQVETLSLSMGSSSSNIPSIVSYNERKGKGQYLFGDAAKGVVGRPKTDTFKAFKMLLTETNKEKLRGRGFSEKNSPEEITKLFFKHILEKILKDQGEEEIENIVVGVPEIWFESLTQIDGRNIIKGIFQELEFVKNIQVISEPAAASAFFAHNFEKMTGKRFNGNLLLIDYGGGTLDITLSQVMRKEDGNGVEIKVLERNGAGENLEGEIGNAGIIYMETVILEALKENELVEDDKEVARNGDFLKSVDDLERDLQNRTDEIEDLFREFGDELDEEDMEELEEEIFTDLYYGRDIITVTYATLVRAYNKVIRPVFQQKLEEMIRFMKQYEIDYMNPEIENFKLALVGGFGNFYLVQQQVNQAFGVFSQDMRQENIIVKREDCEKAIAYGAALLAENKIGIRNTAPYSIAVHMTLDGKVQYHYAFRYNQDIEFDKVYFPISEVDGEPIIVLLGNNSLSKFIYNRGYDNRTAVEITVKDEISKRLKNLVKNEFLTAVIGFSLDASEMLSIHIRDYDLFTRTISEEDHEIKLARFADLFDVIQVKL